MSKNALQFSVTVQSRQVGQAMRIGESIVVDVLSIEGEKVCLGIYAPTYMNVTREEVYRKTRRLQQEQEREPF